ncbi:MAG: hypothetical protein ACKVT2_04675, partial [Saprospiraceae bacterium]
LAHVLLPLLSSQPNEGCLPDKTRPHQVRVTRAFALQSARTGEHLAQAHLMRTGLVKKTTQP